jgi:hypothetical protein
MSKLYREGGKSGKKCAGHGMTNLVSLPRGWTRVEMIGGANNISGDEQRGVGK